MIRLKMHQLDFVLLAYLRSIFRSEYEPFSTIHLTLPASMKDQPLLSKATDLEFELKMLTVYVDLMKLLKSSKEDKGKNTSLYEQDIDLLKDANKLNLSQEMKFSILFRSE
jgi:hypothetical protein